MQARLESLVLPTCCAAPATGGGCSCYDASRDGAPVPVADLVDLTERGLAFLFATVRSALKWTAQAMSPSNSGGGIDRTEGASISWRWE